MLSDKPIFVQIIEMIEDSILAGEYQVDDMIISTTQISKLLSVNPTTAVKAVSILHDRGIVYKKRGVGMAVTQEAKTILLQERKKAFFEQTIPWLVGEAQKLGIQGGELMNILKEYCND